MDPQIERPTNEVADAQTQQLRPEVHRIIAQAATVAPVVREGSTLSAALLVAN